MTGEQVGPGLLGGGVDRAVVPASLSTRLRSWFPPIERREFWAVQALVVMVAALHFWVEYQHVLDSHSPVYLLPTTLFLVPVIYAAVSFGRRGAVLTAIWAGVLVVPNVLLLHDPVEGVGELMQISWITLVALFVGGRVEREQLARQEAEYRAQQQRDSEERYRAIVNNVDEPILVLDADERVVEANESAAELLGGTLPQLRGRRPDGPAGEIILSLIVEDSERLRGPRIHIGEPPRWYEPMVLRRSDASGATSTQVLLIDVTTSFERERGLESITRRTIETREEERKRISRELHDGPLQSLVALWRELDAMSAEAAEPQRDRMRRARGTTEAVADELRRFSRDLRPSILDDLGIAAALRAEAERTAAETGIDVSFDVLGKARRLGSDVELALLRIAQEALRNIVRHAKASAAEVILDFRAHGIRLLVADDGVGLDPVPTPSELLGGSHLGLIGMHERARMIGASVRLGPAALGGLEISVDVPRSALPEA